ncbi:MAG TPA: hypothetical protein PKH24_14210 [Sedimentisphaerales bacterium]|jgi:hypothetical protein|nr:hypothetical protein [Sedimentisphaerales bacterium]HNU30475.1 hypothetical protein [Sedimentisphaerales bacterium]
MSATRVFWIVLTGICLAAGVAAAGTKASNPDPADGMVGVVNPLFQWTKGDGAAKHNVYLGTTPDLTEAQLVGAQLTSAMFFYYTGTLEPGVTYYWRVDEVQGDGVTVVTGDVWSFITQATTAYYPTPTDGAADVGLTPTLTWMPGTDAAAHRVYFSDSLDAVTQGAAAADKGEADTTSFSPGTLEPVTTYYWRVDETSAFGGAVTTGPVWEFTTILPIDDFEAYDDSDANGTTIWQTWIDGFTDGNSGSTVGHMNAPFAERVFVHGGLQSMPFDYNNVGKPYCYSEAARTFEDAMDWTAGGATVLTMFFRGRSSNSVEPLYVIVEDDRGKSGTATYPDSNDLAVPVWTRWEIPLSTFSDAGVDLTAVESLYIGVGVRGSKTPAGSGILFFDDIYVGGPGAAQGAVLFAEDFEGLPLGPNVDEGVAGEAVWTNTPPAGWSVDRSGIPGIGDPTTDGVTEWAGWAFADRLWWVATAGDQNRSQFTKGTGTVAIADPDEWDDASHTDSASAGWYKTYMSTPAIDISAAKAGTIVLTFDSSWRPEYDSNYHQTANVKVTFDDGTTQLLLLWESDSSSPNFHTDQTNETVTIKIAPPTGAKTMVLTWGLYDAGNDWWWAIDNVLVTATLQ